MHKYHCLNPIAAVGLDLFSDDYQKVEDLKDAEAVLVRSAAMHDLELPEGLAAVARAGAGVNNIPLDKCAEKGIVVFNTPGANANGVKELVFAGMLYASRDIVGGIDWCLANQNDENIAKTAEKLGAKAEELKQYFGVDFIAEEQKKEMASNIIFDTAIITEAAPEEKAEEKAEETEKEAE